MNFICIFLSLCLLFNVGYTREIFEEERVQKVVRESVVIDEQVIYKQNSSINDKLLDLWSDGDSEVDGYGFAPGMVSQACLKCICLRESKCKPIGCRMDVGSLSCGYFQIKEGYYTDCGKPGTSWKSCADDITCASTCVQNYMKRYAAHYRCPLKCEGFAREHNGGPNGCNNPNTVAYWNAVQREPGCKGVQ